MYSLHYSMTCVIIYFNSRKSPKKLFTLDFWFAHLKVNLTWLTLNWSLSDLFPLYSIQIGIVEPYSINQCIDVLLNSLAELRTVQSQSGGSSSEIERLKKNLEEEKLKKIQVFLYFIFVFVFYNYQDMTFWPQIRKQN